MKTCNKCGVEKPISDFYKQPKRSKEGISSRCKSCLLKDGREYRDSNKESQRAKGQRYYHANKERASVYSKKWRSENALRVKEVQGLYYQNNKDKCHEASHKWAKENPIAIAEIQRRHLAGKKAEEVFFAGLALGGLSNERV